MRSRIVSLLLAVTVMGSVLAMPVMAGNNALNYDAGPSIYIEEGTLTKAQHNMSTMGALDYSDDNGDITELDAHLNESKNNSFRINFAKVSDDDLRKFPRSSNVSAVADESEWSASGVTVSDASGDVEGLTVSGNNGTATFSNVSLSDADKRVLLSSLSVNSIDSGATVSINAVDADGDRKGVTLNESANGIVVQQKLADLNVSGTGDGSMDQIDSIEVSIDGGNADVTIVGLDAERKSKIDLAETMTDEDGDGDVESVELTNVSDGGAVAVDDLGSMAPMFDDATIYDFSVKGVQYGIEDVASPDVSVNFSSADEYSYPSKLDLHVRLDVPSAIDLTHSDLALKAEQAFVSERYVVAEIEEDVSDDEDLTNVSDSATDVTDTFAKKGAVHTLDSTVSTGSNYDAHLKILLQDDEVRELQDTGNGAAGSGPMGTSGGILDSIWTWIAGAVGSIFAFFRMRGS
jgi:hypothetical protein